MKVGNPAVISPARHEVPDVTYQCPRRWVHVEPVPVTVLYLESPGTVVSIQDRERSIVSVGTSSKLPGRWRFRLRGVMNCTYDARVFVSLVREV